MKYKTIKDRWWRKDVAGPQFEKFLKHLKEQKAPITYVSKETKARALCKMKRGNIVSVCLAMFCVLQQLDEWMPDNYQTLLPEGKVTPWHWRIRVVLASNASEWLLTYCPFCGHKIGD